MAAPMKNICGLSQTLCRIFTTQCSLKTKTLAAPVTRSYCIAAHQNIMSLNRKTILKSNVPVMQSVRTRMDWPEPTIVCDKKLGKPQPNQNVLKRFYRLNSGMWIRTRAGRGKKLWTKYSARRYRLRQHVICNAQQSRLLDKMVTDYWKKKTYFVDDIYEPYQKRTNMERFGLDIKKPKFVP